MRNKITTYNNFIKESRTIYNNKKLNSENLPDSFLPNRDARDLITLRHEFWESLMSLSELFDKRFSNLAPTDEDPDSDYIQMKGILAKKGWGIESLKNLFSERANELCQYNFFDFVKGVPPQSIIELVKNRSGRYYKEYEMFRTTSLDTLSGYIDIFLYKLVEELGLKGGKIYLGGQGWGFYDGDADVPDNEYLIKCAYGYHQTKYGQLFLKNRGVTIEELISEAKKDLIEWLKEHQWNSILRVKDNWKIGSSEIPFDKYCIDEEDRVVIYTGEIVDRFKELGVDNVDEDDLIANIHRYLAQFMLEINVSEDKREVVIYLQPDESH